MKCPFRVITKYEYVDLGNEKISLDTITNSYADCYETECLCYKWDVISGYHCIQLEGKFSDDD